MTARFGKQRLRSFRAFLKEYRRARLGVVGVIIILFFTLLALFAPILSSNDPIRSSNLASPYSIPGWAKSFPQYSSVPEDANLTSGSSLSSQSDLTHWQITSRPSANDPNKGFASYTPTLSGLFANFTVGKASSAGGVLAGLNQQANSTIVINQTLYYPWNYPCEFKIGITITPLNRNLTTSQLTLNIYAKSVGGQTYHILSPVVYTNPVDPYVHFSSFKSRTPYTLYADNKDFYVTELAKSASSVHTVQFGFCGPAQTIFSKPGNVTISYLISSNVPVTVVLSRPFVFIQSAAFGVLGTDDQGRDIWAQFVFGARVSLEVGLLAAVIAVIIGTVIGLAAGFAGGIVDEGLMRFNDFLLTLPFLPFLLIILLLVRLSGATTVISAELVILILIAFFSWQGIARIIRAQVLSVKQRQFVEASRALGGNSRHIIWKHILPNVMGLVYANMAITVPAAILTEAALTFLGFGDPSVISWGTMLSNAEGAMTSSIHSFVWWWFLPPGFAIAVLSMAFVFVGFSLDSVLNPRLRQR